MANKDSGFPLTEYLASLQSSNDAKADKIATMFAELAREMGLTEPEFLAGSGDPTSEAKVIYDKFAGRDGQPS